MPQRILIIDDEMDMLMLLRMIIEDNTEYRVETTNSPSESLKLFREKEIDLVITDLKMPGMDGLELFAELKELKPEVPVIIITAYGSNEVAASALKQGVKDLITKPFRKTDILFTINRVLEFSQLQKENLRMKKMLDEKAKAEEQK
jgi:DNA-binding NtrC family response regulator